MKNYIVYVVTFKNNKKYVGLTGRGLRERKSKHISDSKNGSSLYFHRSLLKYNYECTWEIFSSDLTRKEACDLEMELITRYKSNNQQFGYNLTAGGESTIHNKETLLKIGAKRKPFYVCDLNGNILDRCESQEDASKKHGFKCGGISRCLTGDRFKHKNHRFRYVNSNFLFNKKIRTTPRHRRPKGYKHTAETIQKMTQNRGPITEKALRALRQNAKNRIGIELRKITEQEVIEMARIRSTSKILAQKEGFSKVYLSLKECSDDLGLKKYSITNCLLGKRNSLFGYKISRIKE